RVQALLAPGDVVVPPDGAPLPPGRFQGRAWCPTPRALAALARAGAVVPEAPPLAVLQRVNHRRFTAALAPTLPGARFVDALDEALALLASPSPSGTWLLKRAFGFAGRGQRRVVPGALADADHAWLRASFAPGAGLAIEPLVARTLDAGLHGFLTREGALSLGEATTQQVDGRGIWRGTQRAPSGTLLPSEQQALRDAAEESAQALHQAGYFGPFGVDAFRWIDATGEARFNARCEINARYSMGWAIGMIGEGEDGEARPD
ncbi:MAG: hypothetical protein ABI193_04555, partial [Minicystis sp.]